MACEQRLWQIEKEVLGMLRSIFWLEVGVGLAHLGYGGEKAGWPPGIRGSTQASEVWTSACGKARVSQTFR